ncbi:hypothetical protein CEXT_521431 [Caerostris extrusa]|uniref:Uncharacterized protein n=1 Tax=Caerostris extrusa TaxID=172846 RepID=A0AAV4RNB9_CAEEX|nr:hypothetical protein CEXT_521431 [Caerostris extrusa]
MRVINGHKIPVVFLGSDLQASYFELVNGSTLSPLSDMLDITVIHHVAIISSQHFLVTTCVNTSNWDVCSLHEQIFCQLLFKILFAHFLRVDRWHETPLCLSYTDPYKVITQINELLNLMVIIPLRLCKLHSETYFHSQALINLNQKTLNNTKTASDEQLLLNLYTN